VAARWFHQKTGPIKPWYERDSGVRLAADRALVAGNFPTLAFRIDDKAQMVYLEGPLSIHSDCGIDTSIETRLVFPRTYPDTEPKAFDSAGRFKPHPGKDIKDRHLSSIGQCCLWLPPRSPWSPSDPNALRSFLDQLIVFWDRQLIYDDNGKWPGPAYDHDEQGYRQFVQEELNDDAGLADALAPLVLGRLFVGRNQACPCGSFRKFKKCHLWRVEEIRRRVVRH
jgi:SEC-C motif-containing protein